MDQRIIKVTPIEQYFSITWDLGRRCNYDCMYCPSMWHDKTSVHRTLEELQQQWQDIHSKAIVRGLKYKISFTGGEVTTNRNFLRFVTWLKSNFGANIHSILVTTNGSATLPYYQKLSDVVDIISFSVHSEHINEQRFFANVIALRAAGKFVAVNIMNEFWNQDRIPEYRKLLLKHNIKHTVNEVAYTYQTRTVPIMKGKLNLAIT